MPTITADTVVAQITEAFTHWGRVPALSTISSFDQLLRTYSGHYYDTDTRRFFGTRNPHLAAPGVTVECQSKAPEGVPPYLVTAWVIDPDNGRLTPQQVGRLWSLGGARRHARRVAEHWPV